MDITQCFAKDLPGKQPTPRPGSIVQYVRYLKLIYNQNYTFKKAHKLSENADIMYLRLSDTC